ncbi:N-acetylhexosaminidase [Irpex rosettiformis]|uniref:N-acetylhexosaminidase n=1 Tax=Irpex rosettiformis TaxID=378272 RepID=A0ACB8TZC6_9APHY|nr:N-acetylhexosaminidase [Irpex rosettiformis]
MRAQINMVHTLQLLIMMFFSLARNSAFALWPIPPHITAGTTPLKLSPDFSITTTIVSPPHDLVSAIQDTQSRLKTDKFQRLVIGRGASDSNAVRFAPQLDKLELVFAPHAPPVRSIAAEATAPLKARSEWYKLSVPSGGSPAAQLVANSTLGLFRGLTTFSQLWYAYGTDKYILEAPVEMEDRPAFPYRGFSLDTSRNFYPMSDILRTIEAMSWVKLSILYWHVSDSQSFPLQVERFPELAQKGAYSENEIYTTDDVKQIISYANSRGVDIVVELDSPGHTTGIAFGYPDHVACANKMPWSMYASEPPAGQLRIANESTIAFSKELFDSVASMFTGPMMSSGGDEVNLPCWEEDADFVRDSIVANTTIPEALDRFVQEIQGIIKKRKKMPLIKSDMILTHNVTVTDDTVAVVWQSSADAVSMADRGHTFIYQPSNYFYLDCGAGDWLGDDVPGVSWCDPFKTWQKAYSFDPYANLTASQYHLVLGGQMPLWSEQSSPENLDSIVWPRLASAAEVFWTGAALPDGTSRLGKNATNGTSALARLHELRYRLVDRGIKAIALQPHWCALRPGACDLDA